MSEFSTKQSVWLVFAITVTNIGLMAAVWYAVDDPNGIPWLILVIAVLSVLYSRIR